jgi:hypothetical protein
MELARYVRVDLDRVPRQGCIPQQGVVFPNLTVNQKGSSFLWMTSYVCRAFSPPDADVLFSGARFELGGLIPRDGVEYAILLFVGVGRRIVLKPRSIEFHRFRIVAFPLTQIRVTI